MKQTKKTFPCVGDQCYLRQYTSDYYINEIKRPYTVIAVDSKTVTVQSCELIYPIFKYDPETMSDYYKQFDGRRVCFFDTIAESIKPDPNGNIKILTWHPKRGLWGTPGPESSYPQFAIFGEGYQHFPYLN